MVADHQINNKVNPSIFHYFHDHQNQFKSYYYSAIKIIIKLSYQNHLAH